VRLEELGKLKKSTSSGTRTGDLPACNIVPQPTTLPRVPPTVLYGCETLPLTLREEHRLRVFENRVLRGIFGPKRNDITGDWRKLYNEELHNVYSTPNIRRLI
jgi:hypothetical protein